MSRRKYSDGTYVKVAGLPGAWRVVFYIKRTALSVERKYRRCYMVVNRDGEFHLRRACDLEEYE